ncbi:MAG TPA: D-Ala-D-Ala carboxypeptidase family metallohydrolase [Terriglobales bacterium]
MQEEKPHVEASQHHGFRVHCARWHPVRCSATAIRQATGNICGLLDLGPSWETELQLKNNLATGSLAVTPVLHLADGTEFPLDQVTIAPRSAVSVPVNQVLSRKFPSLLNRRGVFGLVAFRFDAYRPDNLYASVSVQRQAEPIEFQFDAYAPGARERTGSREGIWYEPRRGMKDVLVVANRSNKTVQGTLWLSDAAGKRSSSPLTLIPYQTQRLSLAALIQKTGLRGGYGGIALDFPSSAQMIDSAHMLYDEQSGFSSLMKMVDRDPTQTLRERTGKDSGPWAMWAPMLAMASPDPAAGFPEGTVLQPAIFVRNTTGRKLTVRIALNWRDESGKGTVTLPEMALAPFETRQIQIGDMQKPLGIPAEAHWALATVTTSASPDELVVEASSYDTTLRYGMQSPVYSGVGDHFVGGEWRVDDARNLLMAISNVGTRATDALVTLYYNNGRNKYEMQRKIQPGDQMWVNFGDLIHNRIPDRNGRMLPADLASGAYELRDLNPGSGSQLIGGALALDLSVGRHAQPFILRCCGYGDPDVNPYEVVAPPNDDIPIYVESLDCNGNLVNVSSSFGTWRSGDDSIAQVTYTNVHTVAEGGTDAFASGELPVGNGSYCTVEPFQVEAPANVCASTAEAALVGEYVSNVILDVANNNARFLPTCLEPTQTAHSNYFTFSEINTPCPSAGPPEFSWALIRSPLVAAASSGYGLDAWRQDYGSSRIINSGFRDPSQNSSCGGATNSRHLFGDASDLRNQSGTTAEWSAMVTAAQAANADYIEPQSGPCGLGCVHADWRSHSGGYAQ